MPGGLIMKMHGLKIFTLLVSASIVILGGCTGARTFHDYARAGDTVAVAAGWTHHMQRGNIEVTITDSLGATTTYTPGQPGYEAVRASVNFYPDPVSSLVLSDMIQEDVTQSSKLYALLVNQESTNYDRDWWETVIFVDLPDPMALGDATVEIVDLTSAAMETVSSVFTIVPDDTGSGTGGTPNPFKSKIGPTIQFEMYDIHMQALERADHYVVSFSGVTVPHAIQVEFTHNVDQAHGGTGTPFVVDPVGHIKNLSWAPIGTAGTDLRVIMTPAMGSGVFTMNDFKFYVAGGILNLAAIDQDPGDSDIDVLAFDINGDPLTDEVVATVTPMN